MSLGPRADIGERLVKIILKGKLRFDALYDLNYMNINRATLFPGLDGFSQSLRNLGVFSIVEYLNNKGSRFSPLSPAQPLPDNAEK